jgi:threonine dehydratase
METKNQEHIDEIRKALEEKGITITNNSNLKV